MKKILISLMVVISTFVFVACGMPTERAELVEVVQTRDNMILVETWEGEFYEMCGITDEVMLVGIFRDDVMIDLCTTNNVRMTVAEVVDGLEDFGYTYIVKDSSTHEILSVTRDKAEYFDRRVEGVYFVDDVDYLEICIMV